MEKHVLSLIVHIPKLQADKAINQERESENSDDERDTMAVFSLTRKI